KVVVGIRPEHLGQSDSTFSPHISNSLHGQIAYVEQLGESSLFYLSVEGTNELVTIRKTGDQMIERGHVISVPIPREHCHVFNNVGRAFPRTARHSPE
ncbi:MAG: TOBE domain-containing protein, partial [Gammaproteobacteria bacterium]